MDEITWSLGLFGLAGAQSDFSEVHQELRDGSGRVHPDPLDSASQEDFSDTGGPVLIPGTGAFYLEEQPVIGGDKLSLVARGSWSAGPFDGDLVFPSRGNLNLPYGHVILSSPHAEITVAFFKLN
jgi:hypothetical protein